MLPYFLYMVIYLVPILVVHSFMGQFSSSGFIAAFRLAPLFKGIQKKKKTDYNFIKIKSQT